MILIIWSYLYVAGAFFILGALYTEIKHDWVKCMLVSFLWPIGVPGMIFSRWCEAG